MPELPDVELTRRRLDRWMRGATITAAHSTDVRVLRPSKPAALGRALRDRRVIGIERRGKWLRIELDEGLLFSHLGMTGGWNLVEPGAPSRPSERARLELSSARGRPTSLRYLDSRRFGRLLIAKSDIAEWASLGPDPLAHGLSAKQLSGPLSRTRRSIKEALMDQTVLAGVGNIIATEGLWYARIDPRSRSDALSRAHIDAIVRGLRKEIRRELAAREAAGDADDADWDDTFHVYGHTGAPCPRGDGTFVHIVLGGRGTTFCKGCQKRIG